MRVSVEPMDVEDIPQVLEVDRESYTLPWPASAYRREIIYNRNARYVVLRELTDDTPDGDAAAHEQRSRRSFFFRWPLRPDGAGGRPQGRVLGYAGMWLMVDEAHITTIAVRETWRGHGLGELLLVSLIENAMEMRAVRLTLEVRVSNDVAQRLYHKYGFERVGTRPRYYSDNNEDAYIMSTGDIRTAAYRLKLDELVGPLRERLRREGKSLVGGSEAEEPAGAGESTEFS
ncbi:MAG TPA: ribosomal protein S18-alanine N-acetyltransferase [Chloroflexota bacterium]|nr:ribosomal protein S18-alanine N-acetyltransferase [Chloroflexota bacterium]